MNVEVGGYDEGVGFGYYFGEDGKGILEKVVGEVREYSFGEGRKGWGEEWGEGDFEYVDVNGVKKGVEGGLRVELGKGVWGGLSDGDVEEWCVRKFEGCGEKEDRLSCVM